MRSARTFKTTLLSMAVGSAFLLSGCAGGSSEPAPSADAAAASVVVSDTNKLTTTPGSTGVVFTEFTDFQCPSCAAVSPAVEELAERYEGKIDLAVRNFPLPMHQNAKVAAYAVEAAVLQSPENLKAFSHELYSTQSQWSKLSEDKAKDYFKTVAEKLNLDVDKFVSDSDSQVVKDRVERDVKAAADLKLQGTPSMFIGEEKIDMSQITSDTAMYAIVDNAIEEAAKNGTAAATPSASSTTAP